MLARPASPLRAAWTHYRVTREQAAASRRLWSQVAAIATPLGVQHGAIEVVEVADYDCPFCRRVAPVVDSAIAAGLRIGYLDFPLPEHPNSKGAAVAGLCADRLGFFRSMHDRLLGSNLWPADSNWLREASQAGLASVGPFSECMRDKTVRAHLALSMALADSLQVQGTPTFVANGRVHTGTITLAQLMALAHRE